MRISERLSGFVLLLLAISAAAEVSMNATRITAPNTEELARFYQSAFGMHEVERIEVRNSVQVMLNFGATEEAARANPGAQVVIYPRAENAPADDTIHLIFNVTDMAATVAAVEQAGGSMARDPFTFADT